MKNIFILALLCFHLQALAAPDMSCTGVTTEGAAISVTLQLGESAELVIKRNDKVIVSGNGDDVEIGLEDVPQANGTSVTAQVITTTVGHGEFGMLMVKPNRNEATVFVSLETLNFYADLKCQ